MMTYYDTLTNKQLMAEMKKRGYQPFKDGKRWNMKHLWRQRLIEDDRRNKKPIPYLECPNNANPISPEASKSS